MDSRTQALRRERAALRTRYVACACKRLRVFEMRASALRLEEHKKRRGLQTAPLSQSAAVNFLNDASRIESVTDNNNADHNAGERSVCERLVAVFARKCCKYRANNYRNRTEDERSDLVSQRGEVGA